MGPDFLDAIAGIDCVRVAQGQTPVLLGLTYTRPACFIRSITFQVSRRHVLPKALGPFMVIVMLKSDLMCVPSGPVSSEVSEAVARIRPEGGPVGELQLLHHGMAGHGLSRCIPSPADIVGYLLDDHVHDAVTGADVDLSSKGSSTTSQPPPLPGADVSGKRVLITGTVGIFQHWIAKTFDAAGAALLSSDQDKKVLQTFTLPRPALMHGTE